VRWGICSCSGVSGVRLARGWPTSSSVPTFSTFALARHGIPPAPSRPRHLTTQSHPHLHREYAQPQQSLRQANEILAGGWRY
jgi:hypothetical protein